MLVRFIITFIVSIIAFSFFDVNPAGVVFFVAVAATVVNHLVGDLYVLPGFNYLIASVGDGALGIVVAYIMGLVTTVFNPNLGSLLFFGALIAVVEIFFHPYLLRTRRVAPSPEPESQDEQ
ncbi:MAG: DUF2512 family protein [Bacillota bacterium]|nr:DUF2512 family protein [Bacillota bacterium]